MGEDGDGGGSVGSGADIDWSALNAKLPYERTESSQNKRKKMFKDFDPNRNGYLSLAEVRLIRISLRLIPLSNHMVFCQCKIGQFYCVRTQQEKAAVLKIRKLVGHNSTWHAP